MSDRKLSGCCFCFFNFFSQFCSFFATHIFSFVVGRSVGSPRGSNTGWWRACWCSLHCVVLSWCSLYPLGVFRSIRSVLIGFRFSDQNPLSSSSLLCARFTTFIRADHRVLYVSSNRLIFTGLRVTSLSFLSRHLRRSSLPISFANL